MEHGLQALTATTVTVAVAPVVSDITREGRVDPERDRLFGDNASRFCSKPYRLDRVGQGTLSEPLTFSSGIAPRSICKFSGFKMHAGRRPEQTCPPAQQSTGARHSMARHGWHGASMCGTIPARAQAWRAAREGGIANDSWAKAGGERRWELVWEQHCSLHPSLEVHTWSPTPSRAFVGLAANAVKVENCGQVVVAALAAAAT